MLDFDFMEDEEGFWEEEIEKIENQWDDYFVIEKLESREGFKIMAAFTDEVEDERLREDLIKILNRKSPFANFKDEIDSSAYRQKWFKFRTQKHEEYVMDMLESEGIDFEK